MTLLELLVKELHKYGGWPDGAVEAGFLCSSTTLYFVDANGDCPSEWRIEMDSEVEDNDVEISKEQYQSALAASQKVEWDGVGLPPVGCECEVRESTFSSPFSEWSECKIAAINERSPRQTQVCVIDCNGDFAIFYSDKTNKVEFRPLRSEADKKRDDAVEDMVKIFSSNAATGTTAALVAIYDAIAAGKIPGVKLED